MYTMMRRCVLIVVSLGVLMSATLAAGQPAVFAHSEANEEIVVVARDVTASSHCQRRVTANIGTLTQTSVIFPCPAGSVIGTLHEPLSEALRLNEAYVVLPAVNASQDVRAEKYVEIQRLMARVQSQVMRQDGAPAARSVVPLVGCGQGGKVESVWTPSYDHQTALDGWTNYYRKVDCNDVIFDQSGIKVCCESTASDNYWDQNSYEGDYWNLYCRHIPSNGTAETYTPPPVTYTNAIGGIFKIQTTNYFLGGGCDPFASYDTVSIGTID